MSAFIDEYAAERKIFREAYFALAIKNPHHSLLLYYDLEQEVVDVTRVIKELRLEGDSTIEANVIRAYTEALKHALIERTSLLRSDANLLCNGKDTRPGKPDLEPHE